MKQARRPNQQMHRARPMPQNDAGNDENGEEKAAYVEFISRLLDHMQLDSLKRMLEAALKEIE
jgi:hypothetical protein